MALAMGGNLFAPGKTETVENLLGIVADAQILLSVHQLGPFQIDGAGNMAAAGCAHHIASIFSGASSIPDGKIRGVQLLDNFILADPGLGLGKGYCGCNAVGLAGLRLGDKALFDPGDYAPI